MKYKIVVLGAGLVGNAIAIDLSKKHNVVSVDINSKALKILSDNYNIEVVQTDLSKPENIKNVISDCDIVVGAVPGFMGFKTLKTVIESKKNIVDISFFSEDPFLLHELALKNKVTAIMDCGVAPGMGNVILGFHNKQMTVNNYECYVGGLPVKREWPWEYKAVFSPIDVIEEYTRPARYVMNNNVIIREALSEAELLHFDEVGTLEAWNSDGLRSLIETMNIPNMIEKTLRYPGAIEYLKVLRAAGYFSYNPIVIDGKQIRPIDVTAKLLFDQWKLKEGEHDFTIMRIIIEGTEKGGKVKYTYNLFDKFDVQTNTISMARTTGYACASAVELVLNGLRPLQNYTFFKSNNYSELC